jgi:hypothetical protein
MNSIAPSPMTFRRGRTRPGPRRAAGVLLAVAMFAGLAVAAWPASASASTNYFIIVSGLPDDMCLQPAGGSGDSGTPIVQETCVAASPAQHWAPASIGGSSDEFVNQVSGECIDVRGSAASRTPLDQWPCGNISNVHWSWPHPFPAGFYPVVSEISGTSNFCLDDPGASQQAGVAMQIYSCNNTGAQAWAFSGLG